MKAPKARALCALLLCLAAVLCGCAREKNSLVRYREDERPKARITFFGNKYEPENVAVVEEILSGFMRENPDVQVTYESLKGNDYFEALSKRMASGRGDDVMMVNHDAVLLLSEAGQLADLSGLESIDRFSDSVLGQMRGEDGAIYWVPTTVSAFGLYCNLDLLKAQQLEVPRTLAEWLDACERFRRAGILPLIINDDISLKTLAIGLGFWDVYAAGRQAEAFGRINSGEERLSGYLRPGFALASQLIEKGYVDAQKALVTQKTSDDLAEFAKGESPFMLTGGWAAGRVKSMNPPFEFTVIPYPALTDGVVLVVNADTRLSVNAHSPNREAALRFVEYFTRSENITKFAENQSSLSPLKSGSPAALKEIQPLLEAYWAGRTVIGSDSLLDIPIWNLTAEASQRLLSGEPVEEIMDFLDAYQAEEGAR